MTMKRTLRLGIICFTLFSCTETKKNDNRNQQEAESYVKKAPSWAKNANIYELNIRQYSEEGTFKAIEKDLDRIKELGVDIIWFMPIHPIGVTNRKGSDGSYYSVKDYKDVHPDYGTMQDFKDLVNAIHDRDMYVIIDWVANHTAFDNVWFEAGHKDWYTLDSVGELQPPLGTDWWDVADLNYDNADMRAAMIGASVLGTWLILMATVVT